MTRALWVGSGIAVVAASFVAARKMRRPGVPADPSSFTLIGEGQMHSVFRYSGDDPQWRGKVLRLRRRDATHLQHEASMTNRVMPKIFGRAFVPAQEVVYANADVVQALERQTKHGVDGSVAIKSENVVDAPTAGTCISFEIKPKCGLVEQEHFPSRYQMLQRIKLKDGDISRISGYDPVDLFSRNGRRVEKTLKALVQDPQNNFGIFVNGQAVTADQAFELVSCETLRQEIVSSEVLRNIARAQCWAAGKSAVIANNLLEALETELRIGPDVLLASIVPNTGDEGAMRRNERDGEKLVEQHKRHLRHSGSSARELELNSAHYLRRFLLGRTAMDCSVIITFLKPENGVDTELLVKARFARRGDYWIRVSVVDTELKPLSRLPTYAKQLEEYATEYLKTRPR